MKLQAQNVHTTINRFHTHTYCKLIGVTVKINNEKLHLFNWFVQQRKRQEEKIKVLDKTTLQRETKIKR